MTCERRVFEQFSFYIDFLCEFQKMQYRNQTKKVEVCTLKQATAVSRRVYRRVDTLAFPKIYSSYLKKKKLLKKSEDENNAQISHHIYFGIHIGNIIVISACTMSTSDPPPNASANEKSIPSQSRLPPHHPYSM